MLQPADERVFESQFSQVFFGLRSATERVTPVWVAMQVLVQVNVILRNSGTMEALIKRSLQTAARRLPCLRCLVRADVSDYSAAHDPIFRLQFLARLGIQSDVADLAAMLLTPSLVGVFVWRDGSFALEGTSILVRPCDLENVAVRFTLLLCIRWAASAFARCWLDRNMGRTMLGKPTLHGPSPLGLEIHNGATQLGVTSRAAFEDLVNTKMRDVRCRLNLTNAEFTVVRDELSLHNLEARQCSVAMLRQNMAFYITVVCFQLFAAFPVRRLLPVSLSAAGANPVEWSTAFDATLANATALNATHEWWGAQAVIDMPAHLRWMRVPAAAAYVLVDTERCS